MGSHLLNLICSADIPRLVAYQNSYRGPPLEFEPLLLRRLLYDCLAPDPVFARLLTLLMTTFPLSATMRDEARTSNLFWAIDNDRDDFVKRELADGSWRLRVFEDELPPFAGYCVEKNIKLTSPAIGELSGALASAINRLNKRP